MSTERSSRAPYSAHPQTVPILYRGKWHIVTPEWVLMQLREGLTPLATERIALAAWPLPPETLYRAALESEVR
jgi:hypothetical protein